MKMKVSDIAEIQIGYQFREKLNMASDGTHQVIQVIDIDEWNDHRLCATSLFRVTPKRHTEKYVVKNGDVIFLSKGRRNSATVIADVPRSAPPTIAAGYFFILRFDADVVLPEYLAWYINARTAQAYLNRVSGGSAMPFVSKADFEQLEVDVPPLNVQETIVKLHRAAFREGDLLEKLRRKRAELHEGICLDAVGQQSE